MMYEICPMDTNGVKTLACRLRYAIIVCIFLFGLTCGLLPSEAHAEVWNVESVIPRDAGTPTKSIIGEPSIEIDDENTYWISFIVQSYDTDLQTWDPAELFLSKHVVAEDTWADQSVDSSVTVGRDNAIASDGVNKIFIAYRDETNLDLRYARSTDGGNTWTSGTVDSAGNVGTFSSVASCSSNHFVISYKDETNGDLKFAQTFDGGTSWTDVALDTVGDVGSYTSIALNTTSSSGCHYIITYYDTTNGNLKYAKSIDRGTNWTLATIDSTGNVGTSTAVAVDISGNYLIAYRNEALLQLKFAISFDEGATWTTQTVDSEQDVTEETSITSDLFGNYYISYYWDSTSKDLRIAKSLDQGTSWAKSSVSATNDSGSTSDIAIDRTTGYPLIAYSSNNGTYYSLLLAEGISTGDLNSDGSISVSDYALFIIDYLDFLDSDTVNPRSDLNRNNSISVSDYALFIQAYLDFIEDN